MSRRNDHTIPAAQALEDVRHEHGRRSPKAAAAATEYGQEVAEQIASHAEQCAARTQQRWDRNGTPLWMRTKAALGLAGVRG